MKPQETIPVSIICAVGILGLGWGAGQNAADIAGMPGLIALGLLALGLNWLAFIPAVIFRTEKFYDLVGACTYLTLAGVALSSSTSVDEGFDRRVVLAVLVGLWAVRLGSFLFKRVHSVGKDGRFDQIKHNTFQFLMSWSIQALWAFVVSLPVLIVLTREGPHHPLQPLDVVGWSIWFKGFTIEVVADAQKERFRVREQADKKWIDEGLWSYAQHPNYFGEVLLWLGIFISGIHSYQGGEWLALLSPLFVFYILTQVSGIPMVRARAEGKWGDDPDYQAYRRRTYVMIPWPWPRQGN